MDKAKLKKIKPLYYMYKRLQDLSNYPEEQAARKKLQKVCNKQKKESVIKVGFIVQMPNLWDKLKSVYDYMEANKHFETIMLVVPPFDIVDRDVSEYKEDNYYLSNYPKAIPAVKGNKIIDVTSLNLDYVFLQRPYDELMPKGLKSKDLCEFTKVCYVPYGYSMSRNFFYMDTDTAFFRNVYFGFIDVKNVADALRKHFYKNIKNGIQKIQCVGYPEFDAYQISKSNNANTTLLWTPRWTYDSELGGSHFFEYKQKIIELAKLKPELRIIVRPHPLMFDNFIKEKKMTELEVAEYRETLKRNQIELSLDKTCYEDLSRADILLTDYSSIIAPFFMMGRPIIYCEDRQPECYSEGRMILDSLYRCVNWKQIYEEIDSILNGKDDKENERKNIIKCISDGKASERIVDLILNDYNQNAND